MKIDRIQASRFLTCISQCDEGNFIFQTFADKKLQNPKTIPVRQFYGHLDEHWEKLSLLNQQGSGIFVTVNLTDGKGRKRGNIQKVRAFFVDLDGVPLEPVFQAPIAPHIIIESSPKKYHAYWIVEDVPLEKFEQVQKALSQKYQSDPKVCDLPRVMRLPGFFHQKDEPYLTKIIQESGEQPVNFAEFCLKFQIASPSPPVQSVEDNPILEGLRKCGMLLKKEKHPEGCWTIRCPWEKLHSTIDLGTKYFEPNKEHANGGFKCFHAHCTSRSIRDLNDFLCPKTSLPSVLLPLCRIVEPEKPFPFNFLGPILDPAAQAIFNAVQAPDSICAQSVLAAAALAVQAHANILIDGREIPLSAFFLTVGESGDRKSAVDKLALKCISEWQKCLSQSHRSELLQFQRNKEAWETRKKEWLNTHKGEGLFMEPSPEPPLQPLILVEEPTYEGIVKYLTIGQPSIGLFSDEGGRFFGGYAMNTDNALKTVAGLSSLWDGKEISRMRAGDGNLILYGRRFSLHLMVQEMILSQLIKENSLLETQGFLPRCLIAFPSSMVGKRSYQEIDLSTSLVMQRYWEQMTKLLDCKFPVASSAPQNELTPRPLSLSKEAKKAWITYHDQIEQDLSAEGKYRSIRRFASKAAEHVLRLAGILTLFEEHSSVEVGCEYIKRACGLIDYYLEERLRIQGYISENPSLACAKRLYQWFLRKKKLLIGLSEIYQLGPSDIREAKKARLIMKVLVDHGLASSIEGIEIDGKLHKEAWRISLTNGSASC